MSEASYAVGYGRPPMHSRFQKGRSGHPGGRPRPKKKLRIEFERALDDALNADAEALRQAKPTKAIELLAWQLAIDALDSQSAARRLVLAMVGEDAEEAPRADGPTLTEEYRSVLGERYDEFKQRFDAAVAAGSDEALVALAKDFRELT